MTLLANAGPGNDQCGPPFDQTAPQFHIRDLSCGENDPNFPLYGEISVSRITDIKAAEPETAPLQTHCTSSITTSTRIT